MTMMMVSLAEGFLQDFAGGVASHDNHRTKCHILQDHSHAFVSALLRHELGLIAKGMKWVCWGHRHELIIPLFKPLRNRLSAGYRVLTMRQMQPFLKAKRARRSRARIAKAQSEPTAGTFRRSVPLVGLLTPLAAAGSRAGIRLPCSHGKRR